MKSDITTKQMGDACEMLVAAELTLAGVPTIKAPDNWPNYDLIAQPRGTVGPQSISVKSRTFKRGRDCYVDYNINDNFDWLAIVILPNANKGEPKRRVFIFPKTFSDVHFYRYGPATKSHNIMSVQIDKMIEIFPEFEDNFGLYPTGNAKSN